MTSERPVYRSYLLRLWRARSGERLVWRASLEDSHTGERRGFADLARMLAFLEDQLGAALTADAPAPAEASTSRSDRSS
jgi:hypothetical protein